MKGVHVAPNDI